MSAPSGGPVGPDPERSAARFGFLSRHSFFSRHNPHPHRVRHIQGLNGRPVCSVRDDWSVASSLFPHPLLKSHAPRRRARDGLDAGEPAVFSEAWREELRELTAKVTSAQKEARPAEEPVSRQTQYSAETGRLVPPTAKSSPRRPLSQHKPFHDQELLVLELLCQILQTDSLRAVQRWLLSAGRGEKESVTRMIRQTEPTGRRPLGAPRDPSSFVPPPLGTRRNRVDATSAGAGPETVGDAEVLAVHADDREDEADARRELAWERDHL
ncbi:protein TBATA isoform X2 [Syngnathoides biaculeatus]|uniref:protein TBATA isoform X2 n=1 Tax=Syngnathoides biaculeatus TaxID=300417 RepID=UPI002ADDE166|nr:protein TBATA isoform X2 [Syngnathoides biaculeatus]